MNPQKDIMGTPKNSPQETENPESARKSMLYSIKKLIAGESKFFEFYVSASTKWVQPRPTKALKQVRKNMLQVMMHVCLDEADETADALAVTFVRGFCQPCARH
eukprot:g30971.t1